MIPHILFCLLLLVPLSNSLRILHLADFHLDVDYSIYGDNSQMCHNPNGSSRVTLGSYGDYMCDSPKSLVAYSLSEAHRILPNPDAILWTGDNTAHVDGYGWQYVFNTINITTSLLRQQFSHVPVILPTFGNHDYAPSNAFDSYSDLYKYTWELWRDWIGDEQKDNFLKGGYYKYRVGNTTVLVLNTNLYYNSNAAFANFSDPLDPSSMFSFMESELSSAESCANRILSSNCTPHVHIVAHIPPGVFERTPSFEWFRPQYNERFLNITVRYADTIKWMLYGHHHTDTFHLVKDSTGKAVQLSLMSPAVTPWFSSLPGAGANNPAFRVYETTGWTQIDDIVTYYVNLTSLNSQQNTSFVKEYSFKEAYGIQGPINAAAMSSVLEQMKTSDAVFKKYITYNSIMWKPQVPTGEYRGAQLCSIEFSDYPRYAECMLQYKSTAVNSSAIYSLIFLIFITFML